MRKDSVIAAPVEPAVTALEPTPVSRADPLFEEHRPDELIKSFDLRALADFNPA
jgi:hypothetical protein